MRAKKEIRSTTSYQFESDLVDEFKSILLKSRNPFHIIHLASEFNYGSGRTDVVAGTIKGNIIAFEAKLARWRQALVQAYRNSAFAHYSYVLIPSDIVENPIKNSNDFRRRGIGLCSLGPSGIKIEIAAAKKDPIQPWLTETAFKHVVISGYAR